MSIIDAIKKVIPSLNDDQVQAITHTVGPLLIIAGPGTGKTLTLVLKVLYLLLSGKAEPDEIVLTTFTEKAAFELKDRVNQLAKKLGYKGHLNELKIGTIHSICNDYISKFLSSTPLKKNYVVLEDLTQHFFFNEHFKEIIPDSHNTKYLGKWSNKWQTIKGILPYVNKITEELIGDVKNLQNTNNSFLRELAECYLKYESKLYESNKIDFSHLQKVFYQLLTNPNLSPKIKKNIKYILIDEYQDTNYIQEQIMLGLAKPKNNISVVGDEDQSLYRFRGATVRNILEFQSHFEKCKVVKLTINYRSHEEIIQKYNSFMNSTSWNGFRFEKEIRPNPEIAFPAYPAVFNIRTLKKEDEANRLVSLIRYLKENRIIDDYSQIALLLSSVRIEYSGHYLEALKKNNIPYFAPRAKAYFKNNEVKLLIACYALIFGFVGKDLEEYYWNNYLKDSFLLLKDYVDSPLQLYLKRKIDEIEGLQPEQTLELTPLDYFYQLLAYKPFSDFLKDENSARNLSIFSKYISTFQDYYHFSVITFKNKENIKYRLFSSYLNFLLESGADEFEDPDNPIPKGYVQVMTIHQSKGLEFPVVIVGSLDKSFRVLKQIDRDLGPFSPRGTYESENQITKFDRMRHYYVAFSRAEKFLVLTAYEKPQPWFSPICDGLDQWPHIEKEALKSLQFEPKQQYVPKKHYSITSVNVYETCPQQYLFYKEYGFQPSRSAQILFGSVVHQTIEDLHKHVLETRETIVDTQLLQNWFTGNYNGLLLSGLRALSNTLKELALKQVFDYYHQNQDFLNRIQEVEVDVSVEQDNCIIIGKVDLLLGKDGRLEILDFKTLQKPERKHPIMDRYFKQLCFYAYVLRERYGKTADKMYIYWTSQEKRKNAITEFYYKDEHIAEAGNHFAEVVRKIQNKQYEVKDTPDVTKVCKECDFRYYCSNNGVIKYKYT